MLCIRLNVALKLWSLQPDKEGILLSDLKEFPIRSGIDQSLDIGISHLTNNFF